MDLRRLLTRRNLLTAAIILGGIVLIALVIVLSGGIRGDRRFTGGEDSSYPYSWTEYRDGSIAVRPYSPVPQGYSWHVDENDDAVIKVAQTGGKKAPAFTITPAGEGDSMLRLSLAESQDSISLADIYMVIESSASGKKTLLTVTGHRIDEPKDILIGAEHGVSYLVRTGADGSLQLSVKGQGKDDWGVFVRNPRIASVAGSSHTDGAISASIDPARQGDAAAVVYSISRGISLEIKASSEEGGRIRPVSCTVEKHEDWAGADEACVLAGLLIQGITVPGDAENVSFSFQGIGGLLGSGKVSFNYLGAEWTVTASASESFVEMMDADGNDLGPQLRTFITQAGAMYAYFKDASNVAAWCDSEEFSYYIEGSAPGEAGEIDTSDLIETANIVMGGN